MGSLHLKPKHGLRVVKPGTGTPLAKEGEVVDDSTYWRRRLNADEVELVEEPKKIENKKQNNQGSKE